MQRLWLEMVRAQQQRLLIIVALVALAATALSQVTFQLTHPSILIASTQAREAVS